MLNHSHTRKLRSPCVVKRIEEVKPVRGGCVVQVGEHLPAFETELIWGCAADILDRRGELLVVINLRLQPH